jgi:polyisoprenoid-binding protein YceI
MKVMKNLVILLVGITIVLSSSTVVYNSQDYKIKEGYTIAFKSKDPTGEFSVKGSISFDENDLQNSNFDLNFPVSSIKTGNGMKDKKAQTAEWFNAAKYPAIEFVSTKIEKEGNDFIVFGKLSMKGVTKDKKVPLKVLKSSTGLVFSGSFPVNRMDYKVGKPSDAVPNIMNVSYSIPVLKK